MRPHFEFRLDGPGWITAIVSDGVDGLSIQASPLSDAPRDLLDAVASLFQASSANCQWMDEPGSWIWRFARNGNDLRLDLGWNDRWPSDPQAACDIRLSIACDFRKFAIRVREALRAALDQWGEEGYEERWHYPFPHEAWNKLDRAIRGGDSHAA